MERWRDKRRDRETHVFWTFSLNGVLHIASVTGFSHCAVLSDSVRDGACICTQSFLLPHNIPLYGGTALYLSSHQVVGVGVAPTFG